MHQRQISEIEIINTIPLALKPKKEYSEINPTKYILFIYEAKYKKSVFPTWSIDLTQSQSKF